MEEGLTVRPSRLLVSPLDDDHPAFKHFHYVIVWRGGTDYTLMDISEMRAFDLHGDQEWWAEVRDTDQRESYILTLAQAIKLAEGLFDKLSVNGLTMEDVRKRPKEDWL